jgi:hypothetical protein
MNETTPANLTRNQIAVLEGLLKAGFTFLTFEKYARFLAVEKEGFVALLDPAEGKLRVFSQAGYRIGEEIGMLVERPEGKAFVCHDQTVVATSEILEAYQRFREELQNLLLSAQ